MTNRKDQALTEDIGNQLAGTDGTFGSAETLFARRGAYMPPRFEGARKRPSAYAFLKRGLDVILSAFFLILFAVPMFLTAVLVRCDSAGPALFRQVRVGRDLSLFTVYKFRTMSLSAPANRPSASFSASERARCVTRIGRFLRRTGFDELPQLWNVLRGEMSLVGPRPVIPEETRLVALRHALGASSVRPGLTGLAQVSGRDDCDAREKAYFDALYARTVSFASDVKILLRTVRTLFLGTGCN